MHALFLHVGYVISIRIVPPFLTLVMMEMDYACNPYLSRRLHH